MAIAEAKYNLQNLDFQSLEEETINHILTLMKNFTEGQLTDLKQSHKLFQDGIDDSTIQLIKSISKEPIDSMTSMIESMLQLPMYLVQKNVVEFLKKNKDLIDSAYETQLESSNLGYLILLNEDTYENRMKIEEFFDDYYMKKHSSLIEVGFKYIDKQFKDQLAPELCQNNLI